MKEQQPKIPRRQFLPIITGLLLAPFIRIKAKNTKKEEEYKTLIKSDGTAVRVKVTSLKNAKVIKKKISNKSLLKWLGKNK